MDVSEYIPAFVLFLVDYKTHFILVILACTVMKVVFDYTTYFCLLNFLTTLFGLTLQEGWGDLGDKLCYYSSLSTHVLTKRQACQYCAEAMPATWVCPVKQVGTDVGEEL